MAYDEEYDLIEAEDESESDLRAVDLARLNETSVSSADWTVETILSQLSKGNIDLGPVFQRRDAWDAKRKSRFVESLIMQLPIPQLVLAEHPSKRGAFIVIDGKQRLVSLQRFSEDPEFALEKLEFKTELNRLHYADLETDPRFSEDLRLFQNATIRTTVIRGWKNEAVLYLIFLRLNTGSLPLSPQELRTALHPGPFVSFINTTSVELRPLQRALSLDGPDFRMRDAELLVRYYAFTHFLQFYRGNLKDFLDYTCLRMNEGWREMETTVRYGVEWLSDAIDTTFAVFGSEHAFRKWDGRHFETRFNRAIFDIMVFYFRDARVRAAAIEAAPDVVDGFKDLCTNVEFLRSVESTTKSLAATQLRLNRWGDRLSTILHIPVETPNVGGR
ncbi:DUF262 domain-containing protein [Occallatibacter riparius]|uniref:DUF262 domain-containing protein n=1 Tax=Occallatibacter riparius TaxID=1002689 RepID=A0A9J7BTJ3_9BACT|nr:DUF262 domain-containing protein [Occallatibacter riparius]UWZ85968.1 DUF262 domain-containing protein [Occallatibacter riparius]